MPNTMPTLCMDGFVWVDIRDLRRAENRMNTNLRSVLKTITYNQISTNRKRGDVISKIGRQRGNKDYESAALTIELRAQTSYALNFTVSIRVLRTSRATVKATACSIPSGWPTASTHARSVFIGNPSDGQ